MFRGILRLKLFLLILIVILLSLSSMYPVSSVLTRNLNTSQQVDHQSDFEYPLMEFSTFLGGSKIDSISDIAIDEKGNIFVTGTTSSEDFPTKNAFQPNKMGENDIFLSKFTPDGQTMLFSTFIGGSDVDYSISIAIDPFGNILICGNTFSPDFPKVNSQNENTTFFGRPFFVVKFTPDGQSLLFSTVIGGSKFESVSDMQIDNHGNINILGLTSSPDFPTFNAFSENISNNFSEDHFITILSNNGTMLLSSFIGGYWIGIPPQMKLDNNDNVFIYGFASNTSFPIVNNPISEFGGGIVDAFIMKISNEKSLVFSTFLGGSGEELISDIIFDENENVYMVGGTTSTDFPGMGPEEPSSTLGSIFLTKISPDGQTIYFNSFLYNTSPPLLNFLLLNRENNIIIGGITRNDEFPSMLNSNDDINNSISDIFLAKFSSDGRLVSGYRIGGSKGEYINSMEKDSQENILISGETTSEDFPFVNSNNLLSDHNKSKSFVLKLSHTLDQIYFSKIFDIENPLHLKLDKKDNIYLRGFSIDPNFPEILNAFDDEFTDNLSTMEYGEGILIKYSIKPFFIIFSYS